MNKEKFLVVSDSLRQYRRAELKDFDKDLGNNPAIDLLYTDPLPSNAILEQVLSSNTTFLLGRKGTGKSTIFAEAQSTIRKASDRISIYLDVKAIHDLIGNFNVPVNEINNISISVLHEHYLRKAFLGEVLSQILGELSIVIKKINIWEKLKGRKGEVQKAIDQFEELQREVKKGKLESAEIPILQFMTKKKHDQTKYTEHIGDKTEILGAATNVGANISGAYRIDDFEEILSDNEVYQDYSDAVLHSFPFSEILKKIKLYLEKIQVNRLIIFFDDFSEIGYLDQRLFVDVILAPLNNSSDEKIKIKVAGYPGRVYFGKIDPGKIDIIYLDFYKLYKDADIQTTERRAVEYTKRLLLRRFEAFDLQIEDYFDLQIEIDEYAKLLFECSFNVPRIMGFILNYCYNDRISQGLRINIAAIKLATQKYYETVIKQYFQRLNRFALEPFERKLDRHIQEELLNTIVLEARNVRRKIITNEIGGKYFEGLNNPPASHFSISRDLESILLSLEFNFFLTKYHEMRDKDGNEISIYALNYGLCEIEKIPWGYPRGRRDDRSYFVQRCFSYNRVLHTFLANHQTITCTECGASFPMHKKEHFEFFKWICPECKVGTCKIVNLAEGYMSELEQLNKDLMLESVELAILEILMSEDRFMRANEISSFIDQNYQLVGKRTSKLRDLGLVEKKTINNIAMNRITCIAKELYFKE